MFCNWQGESVARLGAKIIPPRQPVRPIGAPHGKLATRSGFKTSRHYLAGVPQAPLPASLRPPQPGRSWSGGWFWHHE